MSRKAFTPVIVSGVLRAGNSRSLKQRIEGRAVLLIRDAHARSPNRGVRLTEYHHEPARLPNAGTRRWPTASVLRAVGRMLFTKTKEASGKKRRETLVNMHVHSG